MCDPLREDKIESRGGPPLPWYELLFVSSCVFSTERTSASWKDVLLTD